VRNPRDVILAPIVSEKSYGLMESGVYVFSVPTNVSKPEIHDAVEAIFGVKVEKVNTLNRKGKAVRQRRRSTYGSRADTKRAFVTLAPGERIELFESGV
jgi:large subunit ribosomal protein L23